ncbi:MAG: hypothetical protein QG608_2116 [Actinomycetota bacterium]|nr:hypothetical protein [Actinomycetota bacterium]
MKRVRSYLPTTTHALCVLGSQIASSRRELGWTAADLAERLGVNVQLIGKIERGSPSTTIGIVFEAAILCGVPLFGTDPSDLTDLAARERTRLALLPARVHRKKVQVSDNF